MCENKYGDNEDVNLVCGGLFLYWAYNSYNALRHGTLRVPNQGSE